MNADDLQINLKALELKDGLEEKAEILSKTFGVGDERSPEEYEKLGKRFIQVVNDVAALIKGYQEEDPNYDDAILTGLAVVISRILQGVENEDVEKAVMYKKAITPFLGTENDRKSAQKFRELLKNKTVAGEDEFTESAFNKYMKL
jgi:hypothetical protein